MTKVEELQYRMETLLCTKTGAEARELTDALIAAARAEGAEQMANKVRFHGGHYTQEGDEVLSGYVSAGTPITAAVDLFIVPSSVLSPAPKEKKP